MDEERSYDPVTPSAKDDIRPEFLGDNSGDSGGGSESGADKKAAANQGAAEDLKGAENAAAGAGMNHDKGGLSGARNGESGGGGFSGGGGSGGGGAGGGGGGGKGGGKGPLISILIFIFTAGGMALGTQLFQPFSLIAQFQDTFGSMHISANRRADRFFRYQMSNNKVSSPYNAFGTNFKISEKQAARLEKQGIKYDAGSRTMTYKGKDGETKTITADNFKELYATDLEFFNRYNAGSMTWRGQAANWFGNNTMRFLLNNRLTRNVLKDFRNRYEDTPDGPYKKMQVLQALLDGKTNKVDSDGGVAFRRVEEGSGEIQYAYSDRDGGARAFDSDGKPMKVEYDDIIVTDIVEVPIEEGHYWVWPDGSTSDHQYEVWGYNGHNYDYGYETEPYVIDHVKDPSDVSESSRHHYSYSDPNKPGEEDPRYDEDRGTETEDKNRDNNRVKSEADVKNKLSSLGGKFTGGGTAGKIANIACLGFNFLGSVNLMVYASEAIQIISLATTTMEAFDKVKAGDGDGSAINELGIALNQKKSSKYAVLESASGSLDAKSESEFSSEYSYPESKDKTAMQSAGIAALYNNGLSMNKTLTNKDPSVQSFNFQRNMNTIFGGLGYSMDMFKGCAVAKAAAAMFDMVRSGIEVGACLAGLLGAVFTLGVSTVACGPLVAEIGANILAGIAIGALIGGLISIITPAVANMMTRNLVENIGGEDYGNALTSGMNMYMGGAHRGNGGSLSTEKKYKEFAVERAEVAAEDAKYERTNKSPFDLTSKNTFMGNIMTQLMSFMTTDSLMNTITTSNSVLSSSLIGMTPAAMAYDLKVGLPNMDENSEDYYGKECPYLASIGAVGDAFCNPYTMTDMGETDEVDSETGQKQKIFEVHPATVIEKVDEASRAVEGGHGKPAFSGSTSDGNVIINPDSDLAKFIIYCGQRNSAFGVADQNIINGVSDGYDINTGNAVADGAFNGAIGSIPFVGEVIDLAENTEALKNIGYVSGQSCVAGNDEEESFTVRTVSGTSGYVQNGYEMEEVSNYVDANGVAENKYAKIDYEDKDESFKHMADNKDSQTPAWDKARWYQRFIEDQSLAESMGIIERSAVAEFMDDYYGNNPNNELSYEDLLSQYSGLSKETITDVMDVLAYYEYIGSYDPSERYAFGAPVVDEGEQDLIFEEEMTMDGMTIALEGIIYRDERNRSFAV